MVCDLPWSSFGVKTNGKEYRQTMCFGSLCFWFCMVLVVFFVFLGESCRFHFNVACNFFHSQVSNIDLNLPNTPHAWSVCFSAVDQSTTTIALLKYPTRKNMFKKDKALSAYALCIVCII